VFTTSGSVTVGTNSTLTASGGYTQQAGTTTLNSATLTSSSAVVVNGGTVTGTGTISGGVLNEGGTVAPGQPIGILNITGTYTQDAGAALDIDIAGSTLGTQYDQLNVSGAVTLGGAINVNLSDGYTPVSGTLFKILPFASCNGDFSSRTGFGVGGGLVFTEQFASNNLSLLAYTANLLFQTEPTNVSAGQTFAPIQVAVLNSSGNVMTSDNSDQITLTINQGMLLGTLTQKVVNGIATFSDLSITQAAAGYQLTATVSGQAAGLSSFFTVSPGAATQLVYLQQPTNIVFGSAINPTVQLALEDVYNNIETTDNSTQVTLSLATNPTGASLTGATNPAKDTAGIVSFTGLSVSEAGTGYTLQAQAPGLPSLDSGSFNVGPLATTTSAANVSAITSTSDQTVNLTATVVDTAGVVVNEGSETFTILNGTTVIGNPVTVSVSAGAAAAS
jgi:hypothetical protein